MIGSATASNLDRLKELYTAGFQNSFLDNALNRIIDRQVARDEADLARTSMELVKFEQQYELNSSEFWSHYQKGQMADTADFMEWNILYKMRQRIVNRLNILRGSDFYE